MPSLRSFSKRQILTLVVLSVADFCNSVCISLQSPFYPKEAEDKGATKSEYGLVFGVFELVVFIMGPIYGYYLHRLGAKSLFNVGIFTTSICSVIFGTLAHVEGHYPFIILCFIVRVVEATGNAAFLTASFAIIAKEFPENVATTFASLETFFGLGLIVGPTVGGALYEVGGFQLPFSVLGSFLFASGLMTYFLLPNNLENPEESQNKYKNGMLALIRIPGVVMSGISIAATSTSIGFLSATLEPHLRQFNLSPLTLGLMFVLNGGTYAICAPLVGWLADNYVKPRTLTVLGCVLLIISFHLIGPAPYLPSPPPNSFELMAVIMIGLVIHGVSIAALLVTSFTVALHDAIAEGLPDNFETYGLVSGLWTSVFAFGAFMGPSVGGVLFENVGFRNSTLFVVIIAAITGVTIAVYLRKSKVNMYRELPPADSIENLHKRSRAGSLSGLSDHYSSSNGKSGLLRSSQAATCTSNNVGYITSFETRIGDAHKYYNEVTTTIMNYQYSNSYGSLSPEISKSNGLTSDSESCG